MNKFKKKKKKKKDNKKTCDVKFHLKILISSLLILIGQLYLLNCLKNVYWYSPDFISNQMW